MTPGRSPTSWVRPWPPWLRLWGGRFWKHKEVLVSREAKTILGANQGHFWGIQPLDPCIFTTGGKKLLWRPCFFWFKRRWSGPLSFCPDIHEAHISYSSQQFIEEHRRHIIFKVPLPWGNYSRDSWSTKLLSFAWYCGEPNFKPVIPQCISRVINLQLWSFVIEFIT